MKCCKLILLAFLFCLFISVNAQSTNTLQLVENKGQWESNIVYKGDLVNGSFFLTTSGFTVVQHNDTDLQKVQQYFHGDLNDEQLSKSLVLHSHAYEVMFKNAGSPALLPSDALETYNNYFIGNDPAKWAGNCKIYQTVVYKNMYTDIDVKYYTASSKLKYDIIVNPGGNPNKVAMEYKGADALQLENHNLIIKTSVGDVKEMAPYAYQLYNGKSQEVSCRFRLMGNTVGFEIGQYNPAFPLIIDPVIVFASFTGSTSDNWGYTATNGPDGSAFVAGIVFGFGYPVSPGAFQTNFGGGIDEGERGGIDMGIFKFSPNGANRVYATYIGGSTNEHPHRIIT